MKKITALILVLIATNLLAEATHTKETKNTFSTDTKTVKVITLNTVTLDAKNYKESYPLALTAQNGCMFIAFPKKDEHDRYQLTVKDIKCPAKLKEKDKYSFSHTMVIGEDGIEGVRALNANGTDIITKGRKLTLIGQN